jgi:hypothetical protein
MSSVVRFILFIAIVVVLIGLGARSCDNDPEPGDSTERTVTTEEEGVPSEPVTMRGAFAYESGRGTSIDTNEVEVTVTPEGNVSGSGLIETSTSLQDDARGCAYNYAWRGTFTIEGRLVDQVEGEGTRADLMLTSQQEHPRKTVEDGCPVEIVNPSGETTAVAEMRFTDPAMMTAEIEPANPSPFVHIPTFAVAE